MGTILLAYERESEARTLDELFSGRGHTIQRTVNGIDALDAARRNPPDLIVSDILLPKMDGFALCRKWKQDERLKSVPFVFFTTRYDDPKYERFAEEVQADRFLARPSRPDALINAVDELLSVSASPPKGTGTERLPILNEANMRLAAQVADLQLLNRRVTESEGTFRRLFDDNPCPMWVVDKETRRHLRANVAALDLLGYTGDEFLAKHDSELMPKQETAALPLGVVWRKRKDAGLMALLLDSRDVDYSGRPAEVCAACDVSELLDGQRTLGEQLAQSRAILESTSDGVWVVDAQGKLLEVNPAYCRLSGYSREELLRLNVGDIEAKAPGDTTVRLRLANPAGGNRYQTEHRCRDGRVIAVEVSVGEISSMPGRQVMLIRDAALQQGDQARHRTDSQRLEALIELQHAAETQDEAGLGRQVLERAATLTGSSAAVLLFTDPEKQTYRVGARFLDTRGQAETLTNETRSYRAVSPIAAVMRSRQVEMDNAASIKLHADGIPEITSCILVPLLDDNEGVLLLMVANRDTPYTEEDKRSLALLADGMARTLRAKRAYALTMNGLQRADVAMQSLIETLTKLVDIHDPHSAGSADRVAVIAVALARELGLDGHTQHVLRVAGLLHDIGTIKVPASLLARPTRLTELELELVRMHPREGHHLLSAIDFGAPVADIVLQHHERQDGSGYPGKLKGDAILLEARILAVADVVEAICSTRASRPAQGIDAALAEITANAGKLYDSEVAAACVRLFRQKGFSIPA